MWYERFLALGIIPDPLIRLFLKIFYKIRFGRHPKDVEEIQLHLNHFIAKMSREPIAKSTNEANEQHYELPTDFFKHILGNYMKYSCGYWDQSLNKKYLNK